MLGVAQRVTGLGVLEPDGRRDVARAHFLELFALVGVHLQQPADALLAVLSAVVDVGAGVEHARVDPEERQFPDVRVGKLNASAANGSSSDALRSAWVASWCGRWPLIEGTS